MNKKPKDYVYEVPEGYRWCPECEGLTEQKEGEHLQSSYCIVCNYFNTGICICPNCGGPEPADDIFDDEVILHHDGCHCKNYYEGDLYSWSELVARSFYDDWMKPEPDRISWAYRCGTPEEKAYERNKDLKIKWNVAYNYKCGCLKTMIYKSLNIFDYEYRTVYSQDCMNAMEWSYIVRCQICGHLYEVYDGNC